MTAVRHRLRVAGVVQGVGFRPFVHRLATETGLGGFVRNETSHVQIEVEGSLRAVARFEDRLIADAPPLARIDTVSATEIEPRDEQDFTIATSESDPGATPAIPPDVAVCDDCRRELFDPTNRRFRHPFITCTNCGPRFTIVTAMPYDRPNTTMAGFPMCAACTGEYRDPTDRRHHAQPIACPNCGPTLTYERDREAIHGTVAVLDATAADLTAGRIVAVKGVGGYHLACDATSDRAVARLRARKGRVDKPFAVMVRDLTAAKQVAAVNDREAEALRSAANPIVLLRAISSPVSSMVAPGSPLLGVLLPTTPLHHLLLEGAGGPRILVMTSGNLSEEPICFDDEDAFHRLGPIADSFCFHDRPIHVPCDDSVVRVVGGEVLPLRRSRGYAPLPIRVPGPVAPTLAVGGELKNAFAVACGDTAWLSQHLGDVAGPATLDALEASVDLFTSGHRIDPEIVTVDAHPGYLTHRWGRAEAGGAGVVSVQHHHAHLAALMAEHGLASDREVMGFVFDGTGFGTDGTTWGGEVLVGGYAAVDRWGHLGVVRLPAGDSAARNPCRSALAHLRAAGVDWADDLAPVRATGPTERDVLRRQLHSERLSGPSSSMGRLFDAVASLLDLRHRTTYEAHAAMELEACATTTRDVVPLEFTLGADGRMGADAVIRGAVQAWRAGADPGAVARGFHLAVAEAVLRVARIIRDERGLQTVGLTGGVWQNCLLHEMTVEHLGAAGFTVLTHRLVPPNDGGIALGQVMVAAHTKGERPCASVSREK